MEFVCKKEYLDRALRCAAKAAARQNTTLPIVKNIAVVAKSGALYIMATDLDVGVTVRVGAKVDGDGMAVIPPALLVGFVSTTSSGEQIKAESDGEKHTLTVSNKVSTATIKGYDPSDFPIIPTVKNPEATAVLEVATLKEAFSKVAGSVAQTQARPELTGVNMTFSEKELFLAATDGFRLSEYVAPIKEWKSLAGEYPTIIIPAAAVSELLYVLGETGENEFSVNVEEAQVFFTVGDVTIVSRTIAGTYPDYRQIIPQTSVTEVTVNRGKLEQAARLAGTFAQDSTNDMKMVVCPREEKVVISALSRDRGSNTTEIPAEISGAEQEMHLNTKYVLDGVSRADTELVRLAFSGSNSPVVITPESDKSKAGRYLYLVMPIRKR